MPATRLKELDMGHFWQASKFYIYKNYQWYVINIYHLGPLMDYSHASIFIHCCVALSEIRFTERPFNQTGKQHNHDYKEE